MIHQEAGAPTVDVAPAKAKAASTAGVLAILSFVVPRALTIVVLIVAAAELKWGLDSKGWSTVVGRDLSIYIEASRRLLSGGSWYLERQLHGAYPIQHGDVLFPPLTVWFFGPWLVLPGPLYILIPVILTLRLIRPSPWGWVIIALLIAYPFSLLRTLAGNPNTWLMALVALALAFRWPGALILLKPSFLPFALVGIRTRGWWITAGVLVVLSLPFLSATLAYPGVVLSSTGGLAYSLGDIHLLLIPIVAALTGSIRYGPDYRRKVTSLVGRTQRRLLGSPASGA